LNNQEYVTQVHGLPSLMTMHEVTVKIIYLVGIKHSGKTKLGQFASVALATSYDTVYADSDELVLKTLRGTGQTVREFYRDAGQEAFAEREFSSIRKFVLDLHSHPVELAIIATGGGACDNDPLVSFMQETGTLLYLSVSEEILFERILAGGLPPFVSASHPKPSFHELYSRRNERYRQISEYMVRLFDYQSVAENGQILTQAILNLMGRGTACQEIVLERL